MTATAQHQDPAALLDELRARGLSIRAEGDLLKYSPMPLLDDDPALRARVIAAKTELLRLLADAGDPPLDQSLACAEVLGFRARLLADLPVPFSLIVEPLAGGKRITWSVHPRAPEGDETAERWDAIARMRLRERKETVAQLLARLKLKLLLVIIHTEAPR